MKNDFLAEPGGTISFMKWPPGFSFSVTLLTTVYTVYILYIADMYSLQSTGKEGA